LVSTIQKVFISFCGHFNYVAMTAMLLQSGLFSLVVQVIYSIAKKQEKLLAIHASSWIAFRF
jgi:hypothetical protein